MEKHDHSHDEFFMRRALELATLGRGHVSPNPLVGCVIVRDNQILSEGWHHRYGGPHAEVDAVQNLTDKSLVAGSTVYVNLEPCSHFGKTPPCADMLVEHRPARVVIANLDSNPLVAGNGIKKLRTAGIEVITGILEKEGRLLNQRFFTAMEKGRPYIILKWAQTADGFIARQNHDSKWISHVYARQLVHRWRTEEDAFMVGGRTAAHDNPQLNVRDWTGRNPVRVVIDRYLRLPDNLHLFDGTQRTLCYNVLKHEERPNITFVRLDEDDFLLNLLHDLHRQKIQSVVVEGGTTTLQLFMERGLWDEARVFTSPQHFGKGISAPVLKGILTEQVPVATDLLQRFRPLPV